MNFYITQESVSQMLIAEAFICLKRTGKFTPEERTNNGLDKNMTTVIYDDIM